MQAMMKPEALFALTDCDRSDFSELHLKI